MLTHLKAHIQHRLESFHQAQGGAIILLVLAGFLILILSSLMMFDAGIAASDKMEIQTAADSAAYSQSVIKARTMNMLTYANTAKRMFFSYSFTYLAAMEAYAVGMLYYTGQCFKWLPDPHACYRWTIGLAQGVTQGIRLPQDWKTARTRSRQEIKNLENFQVYMKDITPWWAYSENLIRGIYNGATATAAWPPPGSNITGFVNKIYQILNKANQILSEIGLPLSFSNAWDKTDAIDELPVKRGSGLQAQTGYCKEYLTSPEHIIAGVDHFMSSKTGAQGISRDFSPTLTAFIGSMLNPLNCYLIFRALSEDVLDYRVDKGALGWDTSIDPNDWFQSTSNITIAYKAGAHRKRSRENFNRILNDHADLKTFKSNGSWAVARSEFVYGESYMTQGSGFLSVLGSYFSNLSSGLMTAGPPNMWSPRWTAKLRPMILPGESLGSTILNSNAVGLGSVFRDTLPYFALATIVSGLFDSNFDFGDSISDFAFLLAASAGFDGDNLEGFTQ